MQKKFQVYDWFKTLDGAKRIDFLNGMLHLCFPLELRFLGSCIEELARKDYLYLRDAELKANSIQEIQQFKDICDKITRSKMIVTLALLASNNYECARLLFEFLNVDICQTIDKMKSIYMDAKIADEFLLLLTMAANHPAFDFQMKTKMSHLYISTENKLKSEEIINRDSDSDLCSCEKSKYKILMEKNILNSYLDNNEFDNEKKKSCNDDPVRVDNNNNKNNDKQVPFDSTKNSKLSSKPVFKTSSSSSLSSSNTSLVGTANNDLELNESKEKIEESTKKNDTNLDTYIESINFEGVRSIKGTNNHKFSIKIHWSDSISSEIHKTYSEICEFNKKLIKLFPNDVNNLIEKNSLVSREDHEEDFVKEMPLVADYCNKLAKLPKEIFKSQLVKSFFIRDIQPANNIKTNKELVNDLIINDKSDLEIVSEKISEIDDSKCSDDKNTKKEKQEFEQNIESIANISKKNVTVSVANVFNQKQKETYNKQNLSQLSRTNPHQIKNNIINSKVADSNNVKNPLYPSQIPNSNLPQYHFQTFQPIANVGISSPPRASPIPVTGHFQSQNMNPSGSLNNSRCSSPWMIMPSPPIPLTNYNNQGSIPIQNSIQVQKQAKQIQNNQKESKQSNIHHDELLLRYVLDNNNSNSNLSNQISPNENNDIKSTNKNPKNTLEIKKNIIKNKNNQNQTSSEIANFQLADQSLNNQVNTNVSPKSNSQKIRSSSSCSSTSYQTPPPQQQQQASSNTLPSNNISTYPLKQISSPLNNYSNNSQLIIQNPTQQNVFSFNNSNNTNTGKIKQSQLPLLLAPVVSKGTSNLPIAFGVNQYGQTAFYPQNIPLIPGLAQPPANVPINQVAPMLNQDRVESPSLPGSLNSLSSSFKIYLNSKSNQNNKPNENQLDSSTKNFYKLTGTTSEDEEDQDMKKRSINHDDNEISKSLSDVGDIFNEDIECEEEEKGSDLRDKNKLDQKINQKKLEPVEKCETLEYNKMFSNSHNKQQDKINFSSDQINYSEENENKIEPKICNSRFNINDQKGIKIEAQTVENHDSDHHSKCYPIPENISTKSPISNLNGPNFTHSQPIPISLNNLYYHIPSFGVQEGQNLVNGIAISTQPINSQHSSNHQAHMNQSFQQFAHFNSIQPAIPVPIPLGPPLAPSQSQIQALHQSQTQIHQSHHPPPPFLIPLIPPINHSNSQTGKVTPTPGSSPIANQFTGTQQILDNNPANESSNNSTNLNQAKHSNNIQFSQQIPYLVNQNQSGDGHITNFNNMMAIASMASPSQQLQHHQQNILMMMMMGNGQQGPFNVGNQVLNSKPINANYSNFHQIQSQYNQLQSSSVNNINKANKSKKSCYNCGSFSHTAYECKEPSLESTTNSNNFKLNYKPNLPTNQSQLDQKTVCQIESKSLSPKMKHSKFSNKSSSNFVNQRLENKQNHPN